MLISVCGWFQDEFFSLWKSQSLEKSATNQGIASATPKANISILQYDRESAVPHYRCGAIQPMDSFKSRSRLSASAQI